MAEATQDVSRFEYLILLALSEILALRLDGSTTSEVEAVVSAAVISLTVLR